MKINKGNPTKVESGGQKGAPNPSRSTTGRDDNSQAPTGRKRVRLLCGAPKPHSSLGSGQMEAHICRSRLAQCRLDWACTERQQSSHQWASLA